jgi:hypothetical protein
VRSPSSSGVSSTSQPPDRRSATRAPNALGIRDAAIKQKLYDKYDGDCNTGEQLGKPLPKPYAWHTTKKGFTVSYAQYSIGYGACGVMSTFVPYSLSGKGKDSRGTVKRGYYILRDNQPYCSADGNYCGYMCIAAKGHVVRILGGVLGDFGYVGVRRASAMRGITLGSGAGDIERLTFGKKSMTTKPDIFDDRWKRVSRAQFDAHYSGVDC